MPKPTCTTLKSEVDELKSKLNALNDEFRKIKATITENNCQTQNKKMKKDEQYDQFIKDNIDRFNNKSLTILGIQLAIELKNHFSKEHISV